MKKIRYSVIIISIIMTFTIVGCEKINAPDQSIFSILGQLGLGGAYGVFVQNNYAYIANNDGMVIIDISNKNNPQRISTVETSDASFNMVVENETAYIAGGQDGLVVADISNPTAPNKYISFDVGGAAQMVLKKDSLVFVLTLGGRMKIIDVQVPASPVILGGYDDNGEKGRSMALVNNTLYIADAERGLLVIDVSIPSSPSKISTVQGTHGAWDIYINSSTLFLGCHGNGVKILDISEPRNPVSLASISNGGEAYGVAADNDYLYVGDLQDGVEIWDINDLSNPKLIETDSQYAPHNLILNDEILFLADQDKSFVVLQYNKF